MRFLSVDWSPQQIAAFLRRMGSGSKAVFEQQPGVESFVRKVKSSMTGSVILTIATGNLQFVDLIRKAAAEASVDHRVVPTPIPWDERWILYYREAQDAKETA